MTEYLLSYFALGDALPSASDHAAIGESQLLFVGSHLVTGNLGTSVQETEFLCFLAPNNLPKGARIEKEGKAINVVANDLTGSPLSLFSTTSPTTTPDYAQPLPSGFVGVSVNECSHAAPTYATINQLGSEGGWEQTSSFTYRYGTDNAEHFPRLVANAATGTNMLEVIDIGVIIF